MRAPHEGGRCLGGDLRLGGVPLPGKGTPLVEVSQRAHSSEKETVSGKGTRSLMVANM